MEKLNNQEFNYVEFDYFKITLQIRGEVELKWSNSTTLENKQRFYGQRS